MQVYKRIMSVLLLFGLVLTGCQKKEKIVILDELSEQEKLAIYQDYMSKLPDQVNEPVFENIMVFKSTFPDYYYVTNWGNERTIDITGDDSKTDYVDAYIELGFDDEYAYLNTELDANHYLKAKLDDNINQLIATYDYQMDFKTSFATITNLSIEKSTDPVNDHDDIYYYSDDLQFDMSINGEVYRCSTHMYIDNDQKVQNGEDLILSFGFTLDNGDEIYIDVFSTVTNYEYPYDLLDATSEEFIDTFNKEMEKIKQYD